MKILIIGSARHGKDTLAEFVQESFGLTFKSSSQAASEIFIYEELKEKYGYKSSLLCFRDRVNHRAEWHDLICNYNKLDKAALAKKILATSDMYVGMRSNDELDHCVEENLFDWIVGVFDPRKPIESADSFDIDIWRKSDIIIPNNSTIKDFKNRSIKIFTKILKK